MGSQTNTIDGVKRGIRSVWVCVRTEQIWIKHSQHTYALRINELELESKNNTHTRFAASCNFVFIMQNNSRKSITPKEIFHTCIFNVREKSYIVYQFAQRRWRAMCSCSYTSESNAHTKKFKSVNEIFMRLLLLLLLLWCSMACNLTIRWHRNLCCMRVWPLSQQLS